jgi:hypothetical protein
MEKNFTNFEPGPLRQAHFLQAIMKISEQAEEVK